MVLLYLIYLASFAVGVLALFSAFLLSRNQGQPLIRFFAKVFAGLTLEMGVALGVNFALALGISPPASAFVLVPVAVAVLGMSLLLGWATLRYFGMSRSWKLLWGILHGAAFLLLVAASRLDQSSGLLELGWPGHTLFLLPVTILGCLILFGRHLFFRRPPLPSLWSRSLWVFFALTLGFWPFFTTSVAQVALARQVVLVPDFFPMAPFAVFYLAVSLLFLYFLARPGLKEKPFPASGPDPDRWGETFGISPREAEVLVQLLQGKDNKQIAYDLGITAATVKAHLTHLFQKTRTQSRFELARFIEGRNSTKVE